MADLKLGFIKPVGADQVVVEGKYVKGGYLVVATTAEMNALITEGQESIVVGSLCYCQATDKFYSYTASGWIESIYTKTQIETALAAKQETLVSGTNIKTVNGQNILGSGDLPAGLVDDVQQNGVSIVENKIANIILETGLGQDSSNSATVTAIRAFVNSSIEASAAYYITSNAAGDAFATKAALDAGPWYYAGHTRTPTRNDYAIVTADETHENKSARYCYTENQWAFQYTFNMSFTQAQVNAINSGITAAKVALYDAHLIDQANPHAVTKDQVGLGNVGNFKAVSTEASQGLTDTEKGNARTNINAEDVANKTTVLSSSSTDVQYASAKVVYDNLALKVDKETGKSLAEEFTDQEIQDIWDEVFT